MQPKTLSVSSVQLYRRCSARWKRAYVDGQRDPPTPAMAFGSAFARGIEAMHNGRDGDDAFLRKHQGLGWELRGRGLEIRPGAAYGLELLRLYRERGPSVGVPERRFHLRVPGVPVPVVGIADLWTTDGIDEFKTSSARWDLARAQAELQAAVYWMAWRAEHGGREPRFRYLIFSTRAPSLVELEVGITINDERLMAQAFAGAYAGMAAERFDGCGLAVCEMCGAKTPRLELRR